MKEQIEEMEMTPLDVLANDINQHCPDLAENYCGDTHCVACLANALYNSGYRKQSEGVWVDIGERYCKCSNCGTAFEALPTTFMFKENNIFCRHCGSHMKGGAE